MQDTLLSNEPDRSSDQVEAALLTISQLIIVGVFGLLPLFFLPISFLSVDYVKTIAVSVGVLLALIFYSLSILRSGKISIAAPWALWGLWGVVLAAIISSSLSGDMYDSFIGGSFGVHTTLFLFLLVLVVTSALLIGLSKTTIMRLYMLFTGSAIVLALFHTARLFLGPEFLSSGIFTSLVSTPVGSWNDLALFFGMSILLSLVTLEQLPLTRSGKILFSTGIVFSLVVLALVNFFAVWVVLGLVSLVTLMYTLTKDRFSEKRLLTSESSKKTVSLQSVVLSVSVFIISLAFVIGGSALGGYISKVTGISYVEVRPSFEATMDITSGVFNENAFVGIGPNKFIDAWRLYKDPSINQTVFWATDFNGAHGYLTTFFATTGILGILAWLVFFALFIWTGFRMLFRTVYGDRFWYFIGSSSFIASAYLWLMSAIYVPGAAVLFLASIFTAVMFASYTVLVGAAPLSFSIANNKQAGILLIGMVMLLIVGASTALYYTGRHAASVYSASKALYDAQQGADLASVEEGLANAYALLNDDAYAFQLASLQLAKMGVLTSVPELTEQQQQELQLSVQNGINAGQIAATQDPTDPVHWSTLGSIYSVLASASVEGAQGRAQEAFENARRLDPHNPLHLLLQAQLLSRVGDLEGARTKTLEAVAMKSNYTEALFFLTQIDIAQGKTQDAINTTSAIISLEPNNPARYYQLGVLSSAANDLTAAIAAFERAIALDSNYANARYFLALAYAQQENIAGALEQLRKVLELNPGNEDVITLIGQLESGEPLTAVSQESSAQQIAEPEAVTTNENTVITTQDPDTPLISPVNTVGEEQEDEEVSAS